ncbi:hypothetical protein JOE65_000337 [Arthrobacter roseus]|nr:hypothetical protein [Arthrobacter roseus]
MRVPCLGSPTEHPNESATAERELCLETYFAVFSSPIPFHGLPPDLLPAHSIAIKLNAWLAGLQAWVIPQLF